MNVLQSTEPILSSSPRDCSPQMLVTVAACLLKERGASELHAAVAALVAERHRHFHVNRAHPEEDWLKCTNPVCCQYGRLLQRASKEEVTLSVFQLQSVHGHRVKFDVRPGQIRVFSEEQSIEQSRIIIPGM